MPTISDKNLIPIMTADNAPAPYVVSVNSNNTNTRPYYVFNGVTSGNNVGWLTASGTSTGWLKIDMGIPRVIGKYSLFCGNETNFITYMPKTWTIQGSNTGLFTGEQVILDTRTNEAAWTANTKRDYIFNNLNSYRYYRIMITVNSGNVNYLGITAMELFEVIPYNKILLSSGDKYSLKDSTVFKMETGSEKNFLNYGTDLITNFNGYATKQKDIKSTSALLGSGKTFEHTIDMSKRRVHKITLG